MDRITVNLHAISHWAFLYPSMSYMSAYVLLNCFNKFGEAQWLSASLETERPRVRASPAPLSCGP